MPSISCRPRSSVSVVIFSQFAVFGIFIVFLLFFFLIEYAVSPM